MLASKCISNLGQSQPKYASPISLDHSLQIDLNVYKITLWLNSGVLTASDRNALEKAVLAWRGAQPKRERIGRVSWLLGTSQMEWIYEGSATVSEGPHKLGSSLTAGQDQSISVIPISPFSFVIPVSPYAPCRHPVVNLNSQGGENQILSLKRPLCTSLPSLNQSLLVLL